MAASVLWVKQQESGGRILVFAHNAHVMNARTQGGVWSAFAEPPVMMGVHLRATLKQSLLIVGTSAGHNGTGLPTELQSLDGAEALFEKLHEPLFFLNLQTLAHDPRASILVGHRQRIHANFDSFLDIDLEHAFDAMIYINLVSPAESTPYR